MAFTPHHSNPFDATVSMTPELAQLRSIFEDRSLDSLEAVLSRHGNDVAAAVEAIFDGELEQCHVSETNRPEATEDELPHDQRKPGAMRPRDLRDQARESQKNCKKEHKPQHIENEEEKLKEHEEEAIRVALEASISDITRNTQSSDDNTKLSQQFESEFTPDEQPARAHHRKKRWGGKRKVPHQSSVNEEEEGTKNKQEASDNDKLKEKEEEALSAALRASMAPSDRGRLAIVGSAEAESMSDEALSKLLKDPAFLENIDDDLRAAIALQMKLDEEERHQCSYPQDDSVADTLSSTASDTGSKADNPDFSQERNASQSLTPKQLAATRDSVKDRLKSIGAIFLKQIEEARETASLVEKLEAMNKANEVEQSKLEAKKKARNEGDAARLEPLREQLGKYVAENPNGTFQQWIMTMNTEVSDGNREEALESSFFEEGSCHRKLWNESARRRGLSARYFVRVRQCPDSRRSFGRASSKRPVFNPRKEGRTGNAAFDLPVGLDQLKPRQNVGQRDDSKEDEGKIEPSRILVPPRQAFAVVGAPRIKATTEERPGLKRQSRKELIERDDDYEYDKIEYGYM